MSGHNISAIEEIQLGKFFLNNYFGKIEINNATQESNGTHVIKLNATININNLLKPYLQFCS